MIINLATSPTVLRMDTASATAYLNEVKTWCFTNLGSPGSRWQVSFSPDNGHQYGALPLELIVPNEEDAMMIKLKFGL